MVVVVVVVVAVVVMMALLVPVLDCQSSLTFQMPISSNGGKRAWAPQESSS